MYVRTKILNVNSCSVIVFVCFSFAMKITIESSSKKTIAVLDTLNPNDTIQRVQEELAIASLYFIEIKYKQN